MGAFIYQVGRALIWMLCTFIHFTCAFAMFFDKCRQGSKERGMRQRFGREPVLFGGVPGFGDIFERRLAVGTICGCGEPEGATGDERFGFGSIPSHDYSEPNR